VAAEAQQHRGLHGDERLDHRHHLRMWRHLIRHFAGSPASARQPSAHHLRIGEEVQVVREVGESVEAISRSDHEVLAIGLCARLVGSRGSGLVADTRVDVSRHVREMTGRRRQPIEPRRARKAASRRRRRLYGVDVVMIGPKMTRISRENRLEHGDDLLRAFGRLTVERPELPCAKVHQALGVQGGGI